MLMASFRRAFLSMLATRSARCVTHAIAVRESYIGLWALWGPSSRTAKLTFAQQCPIVCSHPTSDWPKPFAFAEERRLTSPESYSHRWSWRASAQPKHSHSISPILIAWKTNWSNQSGGSPYTKRAYNTYMYNIYGLARSREYIKTNDQKLKSIFAHRFSTNIYAYISGLLRICSMFIIGVELHIVDSLQAQIWSKNRRSNELAGLIRPTI